MLKPVLTRRQFASVAALAASPAVLAQAGAPVEGRDYVRLGQHAPVAAPSGKIEVVEFFWYGCPHCFDFEPALEAWSKKLPSDVALRRVPVAFREKPFKAHQMLYFALEALGLTATLHAKVFDGIHRQGEKLDNLASITAFLAKQGVDKAKFTEAFNSFSVAGKANAANQLADAYKIDGVPALGINGRAYTSASLAGSMPRALQVTDWLIAQQRGKV